jgi:hypothetical protein
MAFDIISVSPTVSDAAHTAGDVMFNLTSIKLPARKCKLVNVFATVASGGGEDDTKIGLLFFQKNDTASLGTLNATADISSANFVANDFIGASFLQLSDGTTVDLDLIDNVAIYYGGAFGMSADNSRTANFDPIILKGAYDNECFIAGVVHSGAPDLDGTATVEIHLHVEY